MDDRKKKTDPDDFWDISSLIPSKKSSFGYARSTDAVEISSESSSRKKEDTVQDSSTVIKRYIPSRGGSPISAVSDQFEEAEIYEPKESLIHRVCLKKQKCAYRYYQEFLEDAKRLLREKGTPCEYVPFFSYVPQYNQMNEKQLAYYLWFRECFFRGENIRIDYSYVLLWIYERINLGKQVDLLESQRILTELWNRYHEEFPALEGKLAEWICDFSLLYRLPPPEQATSKLVSRVPSLKEFYITVPDYDVGGCVKSLLKYCSSYDYHSSKFATKENLPLFDRHVHEALALAVSYYSSDGKILSGLSFEDSSLIRDAFAGALCSADIKYRIEIKYCSFSRSNELRFLVGDIVKYAENKLRAYLGIKSRMTVYSLPTDLQKRLDRYFELELPGKKPVAIKRIPQEYDKLYDLPRKPFSLKDAEKIEEASWETTGKLLTTFESDPEFEWLETKSEDLIEPVTVALESEPIAEKSDLRTRLGKYLKAILEVSSGDTKAIDRLAVSLGKMTDALADEINEIAFEVYGDALIEECDGGYVVIEDYRELLEE